MKASIDIECMKCHRIFSVDMDCGIGYGYTATKCPYCGALHHIKLNISVRFIDVTDKDLDEFEEWLIKELKVTTAKHYRREVEKYLQTGEIPKKLTALNHFQEFMRIKKRKELPIF